MASRTSSNGWGSGIVNSSSRNNGARPDTRPTKRGSDDWNKPLERLRSHLADATIDDDEPSRVSVVFNAPPVPKSSLIPKAPRSAKQIAGVTTGAGVAAYALVELVLRLWPLLEKLLK
jgi:hypothetical protein